MGISLVGSSGGSLTCSVPAATEPGDLLIFIGGYGGTAAVPLPEGFTSLHEHSVGTSTRCRFAYRIATDEPSSHGNKRYTQLCCMAAFRKTGGSWINPKLSTDMYTEGGAISSSISTNAVTPIRAEDWVIAGFYKDGNPNRSVNPSGFTHIVERYYSTSQTGNLYYKEVSTDDPVSATQTYTGSSAGIAMSCVLSVEVPSTVVEVLAGYYKRVKVTVDSSKVRADLWSYPLLINLNDSCGTGNTDTTDIFDTIGSDYKKIAVTIADGLTQCNVEVERWDSTNKQARLWVSTPSISCTSNYTFYVYYSAAASDNNTYVGTVGSTPGVAVWSTAAYQHVWHCVEAPTGSETIKDSRGRTDGTSSNMDATNLISGPVTGSKALAFDGSNEMVDFIKSGNDLFDIQGDTRWSMEVIFRVPSTSTYTPLILHMYTSTTGSCFFRMGSGGTLGTWFDAQLSSWDLDQYSTGLSPTVDTWHYGATQYSAYYDDGQNNWIRNEMILDDTWERVNDGTYYVNRNVSDGIYIGGYNSAKYEVDIAEVRLTSGYRNRAWFEVTYEALFDTLNSYQMQDVTPANPSALVGGEILEVATVEATRNGTLRTVGGVYVKDTGRWKQLTKDNP